MQATEKRVCSQCGVVVVSYTQQRFESLAALFDVLVRDLGKCQTLKLRWALLQRMTLLIEEIDQLLLNEQLALVPPLSKAAHHLAPTV